MTTPTPGSANFMAQSNAPPSLADIGGKTVDEGSLLTFTINASDPNPGQSLTYTLLAGAPSNASIGASNGVFSFLPTEAQGPGAYPMSVRVTDNGSPALSVTNTFTVTVNEVNNAPELSAIGNRTIPEGSNLTFTVTATDPDSPAQQLTYSLDPVPPAGLTINPTNGVITWTPTEAQGPNTYLVTARVTDNGDPALSHALTFSIFVTEVNDAPTLTAIPDQSLHQGSTLSLTATAVDTDLPAQGLTYSLDLGAPANATIDAGTGLLTWTPDAGQSLGTNHITVRVTDSGSPPLSASRTFDVTVGGPLRISNIAMSPTNSVTITWDSVVNKTYRLQYKTSLNETNWTDVPGEVSGAGSSANKTDAPVTNAQRFFRVRLVD
jgi:hypothetical protein